MKKISKLKIIVFLAAFFLSWAGTKYAFNYLESKLFGWHFVEVGDIVGEGGVTIMDPNRSGFEIIKCPKDPNRTIINWNGSGINMPNGKYRLKHCGKSNLQVLGQIGDGGKYPVIIDTGNPGTALVTHTVVTAEGLSIYPYDCSHENCSHKMEGGLCHVCPLKIGEMSFVHPLCMYRLCHYEQRSFGKVVKTEGEINIGLELLKGFRYILIDNKKQEVEFSGDTSFATEPNESWNKYTAVIEPNETGKRKIIVEIPIGGVIRRVIFDTGTSSGLVIPESVWNQMRSEFKVVESKCDRARMLHGFEPCDHVTVEEVTVGGKNINKAIIDVLGDDSPFGADFFLMGMGFFHDKVIVIDFDHKLFWVKD
ncbi:MAG: pepsin/retropepsin-like aspartic protease family protein [Planctomycetota bacterium]|jgi:hypothetical protein